MHLATRQFQSRIVTTRPPSFRAACPVHSAHLPPRAAPPPHRAACGAGVAGQVLRGRCGGQCQGRYGMLCKARRKNSLYVAGCGFALPSQEDTTLQHLRSPRSTGCLLRGVSSVERYAAAGPLTRPRPDRLWRPASRRQLIRHTNDLLCVLIIS